MIDKKWFSGPPPSCGWWPASSTRDSHVFRWWDGNTWGWAAIAGDDMVEVARCAADKISYPSLIKWQHRPANWPARSMT